MSEISIDTQVYTHDHYFIGVITELLAQGFIVQSEEHPKELYEVLHSNIAAVNDVFISITFSKNDLTGKWNVLTIQDKHGKHRHLHQLGIPATSSVPYYDEVQTTTGGPISGESDVDQKN